MTEKDDKNFLVPHVVGKHGCVPRQCPKKDSETCDMAHPNIGGYGYIRKSEPIEWKENKPFKAGLSLSHLYSSNQSTSCQAVLHDTENGYEYVMKEEDFVQLLKTLPAIAGVFVGEWVFRKSGRYLSVCLA